MSVSSSQVPLQSSRYALLPASAASIVTCRTIAGSSFSNIRSRLCSSARTWMRSWMGIFDVRSHCWQPISSQTSRSLPFAFTRNAPVGWWRVDRQDTHALTMATGRRATGFPGGRGWSLPSRAVRKWRYSYN
jgi:hypothetical protein